jgi:O-antigen ligase
MTVVSTFSRGGAISLLVAACVFILFQRRRWLLLSLAAVLVPLLLVVAPVSAGYADRLRTVRTYNEIDETSALGRLHFWRVALSIAASHPLGIGLWNFQSVYDDYDTSEGKYGRHRAVHNSFLQALTETGWLGGVLYAGMVIYAARLCIRIRARARAPNLPAHDARLFGTAGTGLLAALAGFASGGFFVSMAYNDLTWMIIGMVAAVDRLSIQAAGAEPMGRDPAAAVSRA